MSSIKPFGRMCFGLGIWLAVVGFGTPMDWIGNILLGFGAVAGWD